MLSTLPILKLLSKKDNNPFEDILSALNTDTILITLPYLDTVKNLCEAKGVYFKTYGAVYDMLQFLEKHNCVRIQELPSGEYTMTGLHSYGKDNKQIKN